MSLLDDIATAQNTVKTRMRDLENEGGRLGTGGANTRDRWLESDANTQRNLDLLSMAVSDPGWTSKLDNAVSTRRTAGYKQADAGKRDAEDRRTTAGAASGTAAGSWDAAVQAQNQVEYARIKATVDQQVSELRSAGIQNLEDMGRQLLERALAGSNDTGDMAVGAQQSADQSWTSQVSDQINGQYRNLLSNSIAGFISGTVTPAVTMGFDSADRWNSIQRDNYRDARDSGTQTGTFRDWAAANGGTRSWWGY